MYCTIAHKPHTIDCLEIGDFAGFILYVGISLIPQYQHGNLKYGVHRELKRTKKSGMDYI
jgi:hypothetical protein